MGSKTIRKETPINWIHSSGHSSLRIRPDIVSLATVADGVGSHLQKKSSKQQCSCAQQALVGD
jgi:hypothetical protein